MGMGGHNLLAYNRDNYLWDMSNRQAYVFQSQNIAIAQCHLFREDIRDLTSLTTSKLSSYLIVSTLKLGFIITLFFNYDRTDRPSEPPRHAHMELLKLLFSLHFLTAFFFLILSVWFAMFAIIVSQSFMTKMLTQTVRIPLPSQKDMACAVPDAKDFEVEVASAFRIPVLEHLFASAKGKSKSTNPSEEDLASEAELGRGRSRGSVPLRQMTAEAEFGRGRGRFGSEAEARAGGGGGASTSSSPPPPPTASRATTLPPTASTGSRGLFSATAPPPTARRGPAIGGSSLEETALEEGPSLEPMGLLGQGGYTSLPPHIKLYGILLQNWIPLDFFSKVSMSIGTSTMLSGIGNYALFYDREKDSLVAQAGGICTFSCMWILTLASIAQELCLPWNIKIMLYSLVLSGPAVVLLMEVADFCGPSVQWTMLLAISLQAAWVCILCALALPLSGRMPLYWTAARFLDPLVDPSSLECADDMSGSDAESGESQSEDDNNSFVRHTTQLQMPLEAFGWNEDDVKRLAACGGKPVPSVKAYEAQFHPPTSIAKFEALSTRARHHFMIGAVLVGLAWFTVVLFCAFGHVFQSAPQKLKPRSLRESELQQLHGAGLAGQDNWASTMSLSRAATSAVQLGVVNVTLPETWLRPQSMDCDSAGRLVLADGLQAFVQYKAGSSSWLGPLSSCDASSQISDASFTSEGDLLVTGMAGLEVLALRSLTDKIVNASGGETQTLVEELEELQRAQLCRGAEEAPTVSARVLGLGDSQLENENENRSFSLTARRTRQPETQELEAVSLDDSATAANSGSLASRRAARGLGLLSGRLVAIQATGSRTDGLLWSVSGFLDWPGSRWIAVSAREGFGLLLDAQGQAWRFHAATGSWEGPWQLGAGSNWRGLCLRPGASSWYALGNPLSSTSTSGKEVGIEIREFAIPGS
ncbi:unnamed protein product [Polarella glacialis]|uniref:Uncharacterized protein n=1 Tax=Polarella glacialis TaxID=89957 RepID=A0A813EKQ8_POLGL|nr:unnamed protein product [Polarella glacialis]